MYGESKGYSLTVLIITIAVILIITTTAVMSIKNVGKDRDVARFMSDLQEVKHFHLHLIPNYQENSEKTLEEIKAILG